MIPTVPFPFGYDNNQGPATITTTTVSSNGFYNIYLLQQTRSRYTNPGEGENDGCCDDFHLVIGFAAEHDEDM